MFVSDLFQKVKDEMPPGATLPKTAINTIIARHGALYDKLSPAEKTSYGQKADIRIGEQKRVNREKAMEARSQLQEHLLRKEEQKRAMGCPLRIGECRLDDRDKARLQRLWTENILTQEQVVEIRQTHAIPPKRPNAIEMTALGAYAGEALDQRPQQSFPEWAALIARNREAFIDTIVAFQEGDDEFHFLFSFAKISPIQPVFYMLAYDHSPTNTYHLDLLQMVTGERVNFQHHFAVDWSQSYTWKDLPFSADVSVRVFLSVLLLGSDFVGTNSDSFQLGDYILSLPESVPATIASEANEPEKPSAEAIATSEILKECPWLAHELEEEEMRLPTHEMKKRKIAQKTFEQDAFFEPEIEAVDKAFMLLAGHSAILPSPNAPTLDFLMCHSTTAGGRRVIRADVRTQTARAWCKKYQMPQATSFASLKYEDGSDVVLAMAWCAHLQFFYDLWMDSGDANHAFDPDALPTHSADFNELLNSDDPNIKSTQKRAADISEMFPRLKPIDEDSD